jgi:hypothetical protein
MAARNTAASGSGADNRRVTGMWGVIEATEVLPTRGKKEDKKR